MEISIFNFEIKDWMILYVAFVAMGLFVRVNIVSPLVASFEDTRKKTLIQIGVVVVITLLWNMASRNDMANDSFAVALIVFTYGYIAYVLSQKAERDGYIHSLLLFINGFFLTAITFMSFPGNIIFGIITVCLAVLVYKKIEPEHKSVLIEIIVMIVETIVISIVVWINSWDSVLQTTLVVLFVETAIYTINLFIGYFCVLVCGEDTDEYINSIRGLKDY